MNIASSKLVWATKLAWATEDLIYRRRRKKEEKEGKRRRGEPRGANEL